MKINKRISAISVFAFSALGAGAVLASTLTNTPGAACVASSGALVKSGDGTASNIGSLTATAVCPVDRQIAPTLSTKVAATVWVIDQSTSANVCCTINSKNPGGAVVSNPTPVCSTGSTTSVQTLSLPQITDTFTFSHYYVQCTVPAMSGGLSSKILTYRTVQD